MTTKKPPQYDLDNAPHMHVGMGVDAARHNGYRHGYQQLNTAGICALTRGTIEYDAWHQGYREGDADATGVEHTTR